jgi:hypothetical protein
MTSRSELQLAALGRIDAAAAERVAAGARGRLQWPAARSSGTRRSRRSLSPRQLAVGGALALAIAGTLVLAIRPWGGERANAALLRRVAIAVTPPPHTVQHIVTVMHQGSQVLTTESWQSIDDPFTYRWRQTSSTRCGGNWTSEFSSTPSERQWFDPDHDRVLRMPLVPAEERASVPAGGARAQFDATVSFAFALRHGDAHVAGTTTLGGKPVTQISWPSADPADPASRNVIYVETATGVPVAYHWGGGKLDATGGLVAQVTFPTYEFLPDSASTVRALSERATHPEAALPPVMPERRFSAATQEAQRAHCGGVG